MVRNDSYQTHMHADRPAAVAAFVGPILFLLATLYHPFIVFLTNGAQVVAELQADPTRWFTAHLLVALGAAGVLIAFLGARAHIKRTVGAEVWTARAIPLLVVGTVLFVMLPAMEIAMLAPNAAGADMLATQEALDTWFRPILLAGSAVFAAGSFLFAHGLRRAQIISPASTWFVIAGLVVSALSRFLPLMPSLLIGAAALAAAFVVLGSTMWKASTRRAEARVPS